MKKKEIESRLLNMQAQIDVMQSNLTYLNNKECNCNSMKQINDSYKNYKQRCDVDKAMHDYMELVKHLEYGWLDEDVKSFAIFFAERVKGGKIC